jgi:putative sigma-54 modulation protein
LKLEITGRNVEVTPAIRSFVQQHLRKLPRMLGDNVGIHVVLGVEKSRHRCEILLKAKTAEAASHATTADMYASIVKACHGLEQRAVKLKQRRVEVKRRSKPPVVKMPARQRADQRAEPEVIEEVMPKKPMTVDEALLNLVDSAQDFVVYRDVDSRSVSVVYRRKDGNIGLIR